MKTMNRRLAIWILCSLGVVWAQGTIPAPTPASSGAANLPNPEDHQPAIASVRIGMNAGQALDCLGRMPDSRKDEKGEVILGWKRPDGWLQVRFHGEVVSYVGLQYRPMRPVNDFELLPRGEANISDDGSRRAQQVDITGTGPQFRLGVQFRLHQL